jgi:trans-2-enoyl-CoA reductase
LIKIPKTIPIPYAATIAVNPCSSYRLLRDFVSLKPGDVLIQNAANSMVGMGIIQMAREMGIKTVNIVRVNRLVIDLTCIYV